MLIQVKLETNNLNFIYKIERRERRKVEIEKKIKKVEK